MAWGDARLFSFAQTAARDFAQYEEIQVLQKIFAPSTSTEYLPQQGGIQDRIPRFRVYL